jgi:hypothetical protein
MARLFSSPSKGEGGAHLYIYITGLKDCLNRELFLGGEGERVRRENEVVDLKITPSYKLKFSTTRTPSKYCTSFC